MAYWLFKSEPDTFGWADLVARGAQGEEWNGVRNYQARNNMRQMQLGERGFFYHSRMGLEIVGVVEVSAECHPDSTAGDLRWECVDLRAVQPMPRAVPLAEIKAQPELANMALVRSPRLSVQPVSAEEWAMLCRMGGLPRGDL
ncbi:MAG: EVE domain-containing protein [Rhodobacteraceae bacterium]|nr:EVE domain-containing protein [Paracoccaceae bacterium]